MSQNEVRPAPGYYEARIANYGIKKTKAGDPSPTIAFEVKVDGAAHVVFWQGSLKEGPGRDITLKALAACGFRAIKCFASLANGPASGLLDMAKNVQVTIEHEEAQDGSGKRYPRVKWVNEAGGQKFKDALNVSETVMLIQGMGIEVDFMRIAQENGYKISNDNFKNAHQQSVSSSPFNELPTEDIPF